MVGLLTVLSQLILTINIIHYLKASKDAVDNVIKNIGTDMLISELSKIAEETVRSYELDENGITKEILPIVN